MAALKPTEAELDWYGGLIAGSQFGGATLGVALLGMCVTDIPQYLLNTTLAYSNSVLHGSLWHLSICVHSNWDTEGKAEICCNQLRDPRGFRYGHLE